MGPVKTGVDDRPTRTDGARRSVPTVAIDPRIRQRRVEVARGQGRRRLRVVLVLVTVAVVAAGAWAVLHGSLFSAKVLRVEGSTHTPAATVLATAGLAGHPPLLDVNPGVAAARLGRLPWVSTATVQRQWPDGVVVRIRERTPVAVVGLGSSAGSAGWAEVDRTGRVLADVTSAPAHLVRLTAAAGTSPPAPPPGRDLGPADRAALTVAATLPPAFSSQVTAVVTEPGGTLDLQLTTPVTVSLGSTSQLPAKYEDVAAVLAGAPLQAGDTIDVSVPESVEVLHG